jgi:hypothetical protein
MTVLIALLIVISGALLWDVFRHRDPVAKQTKVEADEQRRRNRQYQDEIDQLSARLKFGGAFFQALTQMEVFHALGPVEQLIVQALARSESEKTPVHPRLLSEVPPEQSAE